MAETDQRAWNPQPIDTAGVELPPGFDRVVERVARNAHDVWARKRFADGWVHGVERDDVRQVNPRLVPYEQLDEDEREYDRVLVIETVRLVMKLGYRLVPTDEPHRDA